MLQQTIMYSLETNEKTENLDKETEVIKTNLMELKKTGKYCNWDKKLAQWAQWWSGVTEEHQWHLKIGEYNLLHLNNKEEIG